MKIKVNGEERDLGDIDPTTPLLWILRDELGLTGTRFGCGKGLCGACTVHVAGAPVKSCQLPAQAVFGDVTTIEGLSQDGDHPVQQAWRELCVPQCGYCQSGQMMAAAALVENESSLDDDAIDNAMNGNICRCGTYPRIRAAIKRAAGGGK